MTTGDRGQTSGFCRAVGCPSSAVRSARDQNGAMYEINLLIWPALYGYTGWLWGTQAGWPVTMAIAAVVAGFVVGVLMMNINPYVLGPIVAWAALLLPWFVDAGTWRWVALALCLSALPVILIGLVLNKRWV